MWQPTFVSNLVFIFFKLITCFIITVRWYLGCGCHSFRSSSFIHRHGIPACLFKIYERSLLPWFINFAYINLILLQLIRSRSFWCCSFMFYYIIWSSFSFKVVGSSINRSFVSSIRFQLSCCLVRRHCSAITRSGTAITRSGTWFRKYFTPNIRKDLFIPLTTMTSNTTTDFSARSTLWLLARAR